MAKNRVRPAKSLAIAAMAKALDNSKYELNYDKAIEMLVAIDKAGLKFIKKPLPKVKRSWREDEQENKMEPTKKFWQKTQVSEKPADNISKNLTGRQKMARTIGKKNVALVKKLTLIEAEKNDKFTGVVNIEDSVIEKLPTELWDIWESADAEIRRIIWDTESEAENE